MRAGLDNNEHLPIRCDDPSFDAAINIALAMIEGVHTLIWSRGASPKAN